MREFTGTESYYVLMLIPFGSKDHGHEPRYWAKEKDFILKDLTHARDAVRFHYGSQGGNDQGKKEIQGMSLVWHHGQRRNDRCGSQRKGPGKGG